MVKLIKNVTDTKNIFTYFEFGGYDGWEEFDELLLVLTKQIECNILEKLDGIWSRHYILEKDGFVFKLMYHEDFGNCLCNQNKQTDGYYDHLENIAKEVVANLK